ncbi:hypothetical protein ASE75_14770 [Sphingomonas sp. Leaf17]|uniref:hypothetical protein n=1 Tax=Sphingomonas sp. Leaf17 TaxID=1735683 RepID=UPI0006F2AA79|nr:hypothetical protein [Sphingomonas sp. Leaf17]KQM61999.1 hypothetical protein ASE75_14770 [Sphingomonas sp. Leaf17]
MFAIGSFGVQAATTLGLMFVLMHTLANEQYVTFSLLFATAQLTAMSLFEWLRIAATRFEPGMSPERTLAYRATTTSLYLVLVVLTPLVTLAVGFGQGMSFGSALLLALGAVVQGGGDLVLTILRSRERMTVFGVLQMTRALAAAAAAITVAWMTDRADLTYLAYCAGAVLPVCRVLAGRWRMVATALHGFGMGGARPILAFGIPSALAGILMQAIPVMLRWLIVGHHDSAVEAGALFAIDIMQRPFVVIVGAVQAVMSPPVVAAFESGDRALFRARIVKVYRIIAAIIVGLVAIGLVSVPVAGHLIVSPSLAPSFVATGRVAVLFFACQSFLLYSAQFPSYILRQTGVLVGLSASELLLLALTLAAVPTTPDTVMWVATIPVAAFTALLAIYVALSPAMILRRM